LAPWLGDPANTVRIGRYEVASGLWTFFYYPLNVPPSPTLGGAVTVGLSELVALDNQIFAVIERDNQAGPDARIKKVYKFSMPVSLLRLRAVHSRRSRSRWSVTWPTI